MATKTARDPIQTLYDASNNRGFVKIDEGERPVQDRVLPLKEQIARDVYDVNYTKKQMKIQKAAEDAAANRKEEDAEVSAKRAKGYASGGKIRTTKGWGIARR